MPKLSAKFKRFVYRLSLTGIFILVAFPLGMYAYILSVTTPEKVPLKNFRASILEATGQEKMVAVGDKKFPLAPKQMSEWVEPYTRVYSGEKDLRFSESMTEFVAKVAKATDKDPIDARFTIENGKAKVFVPSEEGQRLNVVKASIDLRRALLANRSEIVLTPDMLTPGITLEKINSLGITHKLAAGESDFVGSSAARAQNIKVSSEKYNGFIIKPGETFSFNNILGEVDASTGYAAEKVIKAKSIQYEYGGGICQVSTTLFRAAMAAGLPIVERKNHSFAVAYYSPQGFDATIYPGVSDLKFINNTANHILLQTKMASTKLTFEIYGTDDGRRVTLDGPREYDKKSDGSLKAYLDRKISFADGTTKTERFTSIYRSPALYPVVPNPFE